MALTPGTTDPGFGAAALILGIFKGGRIAHLEPPIGRTGDARNQPGASRRHLPSRGSALLPLAFGNPAPIFADRADRLLPAAARLCKDAGPAFRAGGLLNASAWRAFGQSQATCAHLALASWYIWRLASSLSIVFPQPPLPGYTRIMSSAISKSSGLPACRSTATTPK